MNHKEALGLLLAAEADFLNNMGWRPVVVESGEVRWRTPKGLSQVDQDQAVRVAKEQATTP